MLCHKCSFSIFIALMTKASNAAVCDSLAGVRWPRTGRLQGIHSIGGFRLKGFPLLELDSHLRR